MRMYLNIHSKKFLKKNLQERNEFMEEVKHNASKGGRGASAGSGKAGGKAGGKASGGKGKGGGKSMPSKGGKGGKSGGGEEVWPEGVTSFRTVQWSSSIILPDSMDAEDTLWESRHEDVEKVKDKVFDILKKDETFTKDFQVVIRERPPKEPKKPKDACRLFHEGNKDILKKQTPPVPANEMDDTLDQMWKALSKEERATWDEKALQAKESYDVQMKDFLAAGGKVGGSVDKKSKRKDDEGKNSRPCCITDNRLKEVEILLQGFYMHHYPKEDRKKKSKELQYDELTLLMRGYVLQMDEVLFEDSSVCNGLLRALPQIDAKSGKDEEADLLKLWSSWCLNGDSVTGSKPIQYCLHLSLCLTLTLNLHLNLNLI